MARIPMPDKRILVLLIHGIRTQAEWHGPVRDCLENIPGCRAIPLSYGYFDVFRFLLPGRTRRAPIKELLWKIQDAIKKHDYDELVIVSHSFGTYAITEILRKNPAIVPTRLLFCGSILKQNYRWDMLPNRADTINDCGTKDIWPVLANSVTWGYGPSGAFGFGTPQITDRFYPFYHSDFFRTEMSPSRGESQGIVAVSDKPPRLSFVEEFWVPWICSGKVVRSKHEQARGITPYWMSILGVVHIKYSAILTALFIVLCIFCFFPSTRHVLKMSFSKVASLFSHTTGESGVVNNSRSTPGPAKNPIEESPPVSATVFPDPAGLSILPSKQIVESTKPKNRPESVFFYFHNRTEKDLHLFLLDCSAYYAKNNLPLERNGWIDLRFPRSTRPLFYNDFRDGTGWFCLLIWEESSPKPVPLGSINLFDKAPVTLVLDGNSASPQVSGLK
jgi:hypothetical protein